MGHVRRKPLAEFARLTAGCNHQQHNLTFCTQCCSMLAALPLCAMKN